MKSKKKNKPAIVVDDTKKPAATPEPEPIKAAALPVRPPLSETIKVKVKDLKLDANTQPRFSISEDKIKEYTDIIKESAVEGNGNPFDKAPIDVIRTESGQLIPFDGFHRTYGHKGAGEDEINANIYEGSEELAVLLSLNANSTHGVPRTNKDKTRAVQTVFTKPEWAAWSNNEIAKITGTSATFVSGLRPVGSKSPTIRTFLRGGKEVKINTAGIGKKGGAKAKAARKSSKGADAKPGTKKEPAKTLVEELHREITKIVNAINDAYSKEEGAKAEKAICDGSLNLNKKQLKEFAGFSPKGIANIWPLVKAGTDPWKALEFSKSELSDKIVEELHNRALANQGTFEHKSGGFTILVTKNEKK